MNKTMPITLPLEVRETAERELPASMLVAQDAIHLTEVQDMIRRLGEYNLAVFMPHMHETGDFQEQPANIVQVEVSSEFHTVEEVEKMGVLPVSWRWKDGQVTVNGSCHINNRKCDG